MKISKIGIWQTNRNMKPVYWVIDVYDENGIVILKLFSDSRPEVESEKR